MVDPQHLQISRAPNIAEQKLLEALKIGDVQQHGDILLKTRLDYAKCLANLGKNDQAIESYLELLTLIFQANGILNPFLLKGKLMAEIGELYWKMDRRDESVTYLDNAIEYIVT